MTVGGTAVRRDVIVAAVAKYRLPAIYPYRYFVSDGGLISYGRPDTLEPYLRAASYVDRILKGEKPANMPVQRPLKYQLVINLGTAKTLGLNSVIAARSRRRSDRVIVKWLRICGAMRPSVVRVRDRARLCVLQSAGGNHSAARFYNRRVADAADDLPKYGHYWPSQFAIMKTIMGF